MGKPLDGVRICDFTLHAAGPYGTHYLSMLGAECIKIESRERLDIHRRPHPVYGRWEAAEFDQGNGNKLAIELNLKKAEGVALAKRLVAISEIVTENFRPGVIKRLGLSYEVLKPLRPGLVMASVSASGQTGPDWADPGYAPIFGAIGGLGYMTGYEDGPPVEMRNMMDNVTGMTMACAVLIALYKARRTGQGEHVDVAAREVASSFIGDAVVAASAGLPIHRKGNDMPYAAPHGAYPCREPDTWISISVSSDADWRALADTLHAPDLLSENDFADRTGRWVHRRGLDQRIAALTRNEEAKILADRLQRVGVAAFPSLNAKDLVSDPHLRARETIIDMTGPQGKTRAVVSAPWRFEKTPVRMDRWMPGLGQHNEYVFGELLGLSTAAIKQLAEAEVIA
jgi:crotonobetainyl-CoA:carnitine CoA-transferase CaiB-like acyl-CoA transferase